MIAARKISDISEKWEQAKTIIKLPLTAKMQNIFR